MYEPNPQDTYHLRLHRARSVVLTPEECVSIPFSFSFSTSQLPLPLGCPLPPSSSLQVAVFIHQSNTHRLVEIRAAQRTFEGAYIRTALSQFSFSLIVLKIFTAEFYGVGALFAVYGGESLPLPLPPSLSWNAIPKQVERERGAEREA